MRCATSSAVIRVFILFYFERAHVCLEKLSTEETFFLGNVSSYNLGSYLHF